MKTVKKIIAFSLMLIIGVMFMTGCSKKNEGLLQTQGVQKGDTVATMKIKDYGEIKIVLYKNEAPKGVKNFVQHAKDGYYNGVKFHRIIEGFMMQGGDPKGDGTGGESIWGAGFGVEYSKNLYHFTGALSYANTGRPNSNGSQFFIVDADPISQANFNKYKSSNANVTYTQDAIDEYAKVGGAPFLDGDYTVFGQVIEGMDVVKKVMKVEKTMGTDGALSAPKTDVIIESITIEE